MWRPGVQAEIKMGVFVTDILQHGQPAGQGVGLRPDYPHTAMTRILADGNAMPLQVFAVQL